jgi:hypothetical protein
VTAPIDTVGMPAAKPSPERNHMNIDRFVFAFAGTVILLSVLLTFTVHVGWIALAVFVGLNMLQAAFTKFCPLAFILKRAGLRPGPAFT